MTIKKIEKNKNHTIFLKTFNSWRYDIIWIQYDSKYWRSDRVLKKTDNWIDIVKFIVTDMTFSKIDHFLIKDNLRIYESENFDEDDRDEKKSVEEKS